MKIDRVWAIEVSRLNIQGFAEVSPESSPEHHPVPSEYLAVVFYERSSFEHACISEQPIQVVKILP
jgi:hypothetical protein